MVKSVFIYFFFFIFCPKNWCWINSKQTRNENFNLNQLFSYFLIYTQYYTIDKSEPGIERGRTLTRITSVNKYGGAGANFRGRKSNSLMNLCGGKNPTDHYKFSFFISFFFQS